METRFYSKKNQRQNRSCVVFVEGQDDAVFLSTLLDEINADPEKIGIVEVEGKENFPPRLRSFLKSSNFTQGVVKTIAVVCDSDENPKSIEQQISDALVASGQPEIVLGGYIAGDRGVRFGLFTMPDPVSQGDLEKLCLDTVMGHPLEGSAEVYISSAEKFAHDSRVRLNGSRHKRKAQVFLAGVPNEVVRGAGRGFANGCFDISHEALNPLREFLLEAMA